MSDLASVFDILSRKLPGYEDRPQQIEMAEEVSACLKENVNLLVETGTGVGKSLAYLIPSILSGEKTVVSTASLALQDQLVHKDLFFLETSRLFGRQKFTYALLKGKNNYLCLKRLRELLPGMESGKPGLWEPDEPFLQWVSATETGDRDELSFVPEFWGRVCGDSDDCNAGQCPLYGECFYYVHFKTLFRKDIIVVNHHLLFYDLLSDFSLLPFHEHLIIDEAHRVDDVISHVLGSLLNHSRVTWILYRLRGLRMVVDHLFEPVDAFFRMGSAPFQTASQVPRSTVEGLKKLSGALALEKVVHRLESYDSDPSDDELNDRIATTIRALKSLAGDINDFIEMSNVDRVYYMTSQKGFIELKSSLVESQRPFGDLVGIYKNVIMTSATLTVSGNFGFLKSRLGIPSPGSGQGPEFREKMIGSPFDYRRQALLYLDKELPSPAKESSESFQRMGLTTIQDLISASSGRALVLFTSYKHLNFVSEHIKTDHPFKSQGDMPPGRLIQWFRRTPHSVLLATTTFWQGIDIKGEDLSLVIITKMPFGSPGDPVYDERCKRLKGRWFSDLALPSAILLLRQGIGRLIRGVNDYGVVGILDTRLFRSSYGKTVVASLPEMEIVHSIKQVEIFFQGLSSRNSHPDRRTKRERKDNSSNVSRIVSLGNSGDPSAVPALIGFAKSTNGNERRLAASGLGKLAHCMTQKDEAVRVLELLLTDEKPQVRCYAMKALEKMGVINQSEFKRILSDQGEAAYNVCLAKRLIINDKKT